MAIIRGTDKANTIKGKATDDRIYGLLEATRSTVAQETTSSTVMGVTIGFWAGWETTSSTAATASTI